MKLLITGAWKASAAQLKTVEALGHQVIWHQQEKDPLPIPYDQVEGVICNGLFLYHDIKRFTSLKYVQLTSAGLDRVPTAYIRQRGIALFTAKGVYSVPMAEYAVWGVLDWLKKGRFFAENQKNMQWEKNRDLLELADKTVCIVGCGNVGRACAKRFRAFDCCVIGVNRTVREDICFDIIYPLEQMESALAEADIVVLSLPLTNETRHLIGQKQFVCMKRGALLVNIARGAVVDTAALIQALQNGLGGAVLDVFEEEPLSEDSPLWRMENVILTPHNSFVGEGNSSRLGRVILDNLAEHRQMKHGKTEMGVLT